MKYYLAEELEGRLTKWYDAGHPIKVDKRVIKKFLTQNFTTIYEKEVYVKRERWGGDRSYAAVYYVGKKR